MRELAHFAAAPLPTGTALLSLCGILNRLRSQNADPIMESPNLIGGKGIWLSIPASRLRRQRRLELRWQLLAPFPRPAQDTQAGDPA